MCEHPLPCGDLRHHRRRDERVEWLPEVPTRHLLAQARRAERVHMRGMSSRDVRDIARRGVGK